MQETKSTPVHDQKAARILTAAGIQYDTEGERRVRSKFNASNSSLVDEIKARTAELINLVESIEQKDIASAREAMRCFETGAMYAVKAATA